MTEFNLSLPLEELERKAKEDPAGYRQHVVRLAALGYGYIAFAIAVLIALALVVFWLLKNHTSIVLLKLLLVPSIAIFLVAKSLFVKIDAPQGIELSREDAPKLYEIIDELRTAGQVPEVHHVLLNSEFNCFVTQLPKFGMFGPSSNYLVLGMPLMYTFSPEQFRWVLAHELGHIANLHGKLSLWIYHQQIVWVKIINNLGDEDFTSALFVRFVKWYFPLFMQHTFVMRRQQEYAADEFAARTSGGPANGRQALVSLAVNGNQYGTFLEEYFRFSATSKTPPSEFHGKMKSTLLNPMEENEALPYIRLAITKHDEMDSHPSLSERIKALDGDADEHSLFRMYSEGRHHDTNAAEAFLGTNAARFETELNDMFEKEVSELWDASHESYQAQRAELSALEERLDTLERPDRIEFSRRLMTLTEFDRAIALLRKLLEEKEEPEVRYLLGAALYEQKNPEAVEHLKAVAESAVFGQYACGALYEHYKKAGDDETAQMYLDKATEQAKKIDAAMEELALLVDMNVYIEHSLTAHHVEQIVKFISEQAPSIDKAWLVAREMPAIIGRDQPILIVHTNKKFAWNDEDLYKDVPLIQNASVCNGIVVIPSTACPKALNEAMKKAIPNAEIFDRKKLAEV